MTVIHEQRQRYLYAMSTNPLPEVWLRGAQPGISPLLQPVAHALLQAREEIEILMTGFPDALLWERPAGVASPGFHLQHLAGVLDRLFTYAKGDPLSAQQLNDLKTEGQSSAAENSVASLLNAFYKKVDESIRFLERLDEKSLTEARSVGRAKLPSTVLGLLFHSAEHTMRHTGQLLVTVKVLSNTKAKE